MGRCKLECVPDSKHNKCCLECEEYASCGNVCDILDCYEYAEDCPDYVKEDEDNENN